MDRLSREIRLVESKVLDQHHKTQPLLARTQVEAVSHLLHVYEKLLNMFSQSSLPQEVLASEHMNLSRALEQSIFWIFNEAQATCSFSRAPMTQIDQEAKLLLLWAKDYSSLCDAHIAASRGLYHTEINRKLKLISFHRAVEFDDQFLVSQLFSLNNR